MALSVTGSKLSGVILLFTISLIGSQEIFFELKDRQFQEIIFPGDVTVAMICKITNVKAIEVKITNNSGQIVATNNGEGNCLEFVISLITSTESLNYTCSVRYNSRDNVPAVTETKTLILNVSERDHSCFRNGTGINQPYQVGDLLLLSCYCRLKEPCLWTETAVGSEVGRAIMPLEEREYNNKKIRRIIVGPFNDTAIMTLRYDCSHGSTIDKRCSIGPANNSASDLILSPTAPSIGLLECPVTGVPTEYLETFSSTDGDISLTTVISETTSSTSKLSFDIVNHTADESNESFITLIIVIAGAFTLLIALVTSVLVLIVVRRKNNYTKATKEGHEVDDQDKKVQNQRYEGNLTDDCLDLSQQGRASDIGVGFANVINNRDVDEYQGTHAPLPMDKYGYAHDNDDTHEDQFQTADTSDYAIPVALMKNSMQSELAEAIGLYAQVNKLNITSNEHT